jgi:general secretion pathway protein K
MSLLTKEKGIALMVVLWMTTLVIVITFAFAVMVRTEVFSTITYKEQLENKYLAEAGMNRALMEIYYRNANKNNTIDTENIVICKTDGTFYQGDIAQGHYQYALTDETGKININLLNDTTAVILNNLLVNMGVEKTEADSIVDCILDWKDGDDLHRLHGVESDYYQSLPNPYKAKDANFDNLEELLLVKGIKNELLFGKEGKKGLIEYLTVHTSSPQININVASTEVLRAIPMMTDDMLQLILKYRSADNVKKDGSGMQSMLSPGEYARIAAYVTTADSNIYSVVSVGYRETAQSHYGLKAVVAIEGAGRYRILYYQNPAHVVILKNEQIPEHNS